MRARRLAGYDLTAAMVRGVLNCMAGDPRVNLTPPQEQPVTAYGNVVSFAKPEPRGAGQISYKAECPLLANGIFHHHKRLYAKSWKYCPGLYRLNRQYFTTKANIKALYIVAAQGGVIHKADSRAYVAWYPRHHELGYMMPASLMGRGTCGTQWFREPFLVNTTENVPDPRPKMQGQFLRKCKRCWETE